MFGGEPSKETEESATNWHESKRRQGRADVSVQPSSRRGLTPQSDDTCPASKAALRPRRAQEMRQKSQGATVRGIQTPMLQKPGFQEKTWFLAPNIERAAIKPEAEAWIKPRVMPAPSPQANRLCTSVSRPDVSVRRLE